MNSRILALVAVSLVGCGGKSPGIQDSGVPGTGDDASVTGDGSPTDDASQPMDSPFPFDTALGMPLSVPAGQWTWVDFPDSTCDDGSPTGIAVSPGDAGKLLIFFEGGGACWDALTCFGLNTAVHGPFGQAQWDAQSATITTSSILDRTLTGNPFAGYGMVFVPYCTGDLHAGNNVATYDVAGQAKPYHHQGAANVAAYMARIAATWTNATDVAITGSSAGGFGALMNYEPIRAHFPGAKMIMIDDSGPPLAGTSIPASERMAWYAEWHVGDLIDPQCADCKDDVSNLPAAVAAKYPNDRMALLSSLQDQTIRTYFMLTADGMQTALQSLKTDKLDALPNFHTFFVSGETHTMLGNPSGFVAGGTALLPWLGQMSSADAAWTSVGP
ncbi:MAG TPA: pectin acetylesterase-family hydrolase [Polyangia bacterium]|jgi:hypothetical protein